MIVTTVFEEYVAFHSFESKLWLLDRQNKQANSENYGHPPGNNFDLEVCQRSRSRHGANWKGLSQGSCMTNINALSFRLQKILARLKFLWQTEGQTDGWTNFNVPRFRERRGTNIPVSYSSNHIQRWIIQSVRHIWPYFDLQLSVIFWGLKENFIISTCRPGFHFWSDYLCQPNKYFIDSFQFDFSFVQLDWMDFNANNMNNISKFRSKVKRWKEHYTLKLSISLK